MPAVTYELPFRVPSEHVPRQGSNAWHVRVERSEGWTTLMSTERYLALALGKDLLPAILEHALLPPLSQAERILST